MSTQYVQHQSGDGDIWEVTDDLGDEWEVRSKINPDDEHYLPKSEFVPVAADGRRID